MTDPLSNVKNALQSSGLNAALRVLNDRVGHRFTAVYKLDDGTMRNVAIVDKLGEVVPADFLAVPIANSFCQFVLRDGAFLTADSSKEAMLDGHPFQGVVHSYVGLPLTQGGGDLFGTFCRFDFPPQPLPDDEYLFLKKAVRLLPGYVIS